MLRWRRKDGGFARGYFLEPTVLADLSDISRVMHEETFGPVAPVLPVRTEAEAIARANASRYGLAAYVFTWDLSRAIRVCEALEFGVVGLNDPFPAVPHAPFGGWKESGIGREGGLFGLEEFLEIKYISIGF
jgi:succinate-semialdehyde dehydrogenase/glutarate-semialdehyde dehydrogenase